MDSLNKFIIKRTFTTESILLDVSIDEKNLYFEIFLDDFQTVFNVFEEKKQIFHEIIDGIKL